MLYAPTWRDDLATNYRRASWCRHLDVETRRRARWATSSSSCMRGHRFHARGARDSGRDSTRLIDVTDYPEINDLILASDAAVLDYSSLRFDFALTGRPMLFLVPDLRHATPAASAASSTRSRPARPGPLLRRRRRGVTALQDLDAGLGTVRRGAHDAFHARFNYLQDGTGRRAGRGAVLRLRARSLAGEAALDLGERLVVLVAGERVDAAQVDDVAGAGGEHGLERRPRDDLGSSSESGGSCPNALVRIGVPVRSGFMQLTRTRSRGPLLGQRLGEVDRRRLRRRVEAVAAAAPGVGGRREQQQAAAGRATAGRLLGDQIGAR